MQIYTLLILDVFSAKTEKYKNNWHCLIDQNQKHTKNIVCCRNERAGRGARYYRQSKYMADARSRISWHLLIGIHWYIEHYGLDWFSSIYRADCFDFWISCCYVSSGEFFAFILLINWNYCNVNIIFVSILIFINYLHMKQNLYCYNNRTLLFLLIEHIWSIAA